MHTSPLSMIDDQRVVDHASPTHSTFPSFELHREDPDGLHETVEQPARGFTEDAGSGDAGDRVLGHLELLLQEQEEHGTDEEVKRVGRRQDEADADARGGGHEALDVIEALGHGQQDASQAKNDHQAHRSIRQCPAVQQDREPSPGLGYRSGQGVVGERDVDERGHEVEDRDAHDRDDRQNHGL